MKRSQSARRSWGCASHLAAELREGAASHSVLILEKSILSLFTPLRAVGVTALPCPGGQVACQSESTARPSRAAERIFSMSGPLSLFWRGPRFGRVRPRRPRGPELREDAVTDGVPFLEVSIFPQFTALRAVGVDVPPVFYWRLAVSLDSQYSIVVHAPTWLARALARPLGRFSPPVRTRSHEWLEH